MKILYSFAILILPFTVFAQKAPYDSNCTDLGKEWGVIKSFDPKSISKRIYADSYINILRAKKTEINKSVKSQIHVWKNMPELCRQGIGVEIDWQKNQLLIVDKDAFENFRLRGSVLDQNVCGLLIPKINRPDAKPDSRGNIDMQGLGAIESHNKLGDVGHHNYCINQLQMGVLSDVSSKLKQDLAFCDDQRSKGVLKSEKGDRCEGYPKQLESKMGSVLDEMERIKKDNDKDDQPVKRVNKEDNSIFNKFTDNIESLKKARQEARARAQIVKPIDAQLLSGVYIEGVEDLKKCGKTDDLTISNISDGIDNCENVKLNENVKDFYDSNKKVMKNYYSKKLIKEMNGQSFGKAVEASFHLLDSDPETTALKTQLYNMVQSGTLKKHSKKACELFSNKDVCQDSSLLKIFEDSITKSAQSYGESSKNGHVSPLAYKDEDVSSSMNETALNMHELCDNIYKNHTRSKVPTADEEENFKQQFRFMEKNWTLYLYNESVRVRLGMENLIGPEGEMCPGYKANRSFKFEPITASDIKNVKKTYRDAAKKQITTTEEIQAPRRTNLTNAKVSDIAGAYICDMSIDEKIDAYALKKLTNGHPYTTGQVIGSVDESQKLAYLSVICSAKKCESNIDSFNQPIKDFADIAAQVGLVALTITNPPIGLAASITYKTGKYTQKYLNAKSELDDFNASLATNGFNASKYDEKLAEKYKKLNKDALAEKLVINLTMMLAKTAIASGLAEKFLHTKAGEQFLKHTLNRLSNAKPSEIAGKIYQELSKKAAKHGEPVKHELHHAVHGALEKSILYMDAAL